MSIDLGEIKVSKTYELEQRIKWLEKRLCMIDERVNNLEPKEVPLGGFQKSRRQEKVEELAKVLFETPVSRSSTSRPHELAEAALEWVEKQMPKNRLSERRVIGDTIESYNQALSDVRRNLGLDQ